MGSGIMFWFRAYVQGHQLSRTLVLAWIAAAVSALFGDVPLPLPSFMSTYTPPVTLDALLAMFIAVAVLWSLTTPLAWFEQRCSSLWLLADIATTLVLIMPAIAVSSFALSPSMLVRDVAIYLCLMFVISAVWTTEASIVVCSVWIVAQVPFYAPDQHPVMQVFTIIMHETSNTTTVIMFMAMIVLLALLGGRMKLRSIHQ